MANEGKYSTFGRFVLGTHKFCFESIRRLDRNRMKDHSAEVMCGTLEHNSQDQSDDIKEYGFEVILQPTWEELKVLCPLFGFTETSSGSGVFRPNDTPTPNISAAKIDEVVNVRAYADCKIDKAVFQSSRSSALRLRLVVMAKTAADGSSISESGVTDSSSPYIFSQSALSLNATSYYMSSWVYAIDNRLRREFNNSVTATNIDQTDRVQHVMLNLPFNTEGKVVHDFLWSSSRINGFAGFTTFTRGGKVCRFDWDNLKADGTNPDFLNRDELRQQHSFKVFDKTTESDAEPSASVTFTSS